MSDGVVYHAFNEPTPPVTLNARWKLLPDGQWLLTIRYEHQLLLAETARCPYLTILGTNA